MQAQLATINSTYTYVNPNLIILADCWIRSTILTFDITQICRHQQIVNHARQEVRLRSYLSHLQINEVPDPSQLEDVFTYLAILGIDKSDLPALVKAFPEVIACEVEGQLEASVKVLQKDWKLTGEVLTKAVLRRPQVCSYLLGVQGGGEGEIYLSHTSTEFAGWSM